MIRSLSNPLQPVLQHRPVRLLQNVASDLYYSVRANAQNVGIESTVMEPAKRDPIWHDGLAARICVRQDMGGVE